MTEPAGPRPWARLLPVAIGAGGFTGLAFVDVGLPQAAWHTACVALLMAFWWITQAMPLPATGLLPLVLFPILGVTTFTDAAAPFASQAIFLPAAATLVAPGGTGQVALLLPLTLAASCAFMTPVATPPNAIVFGSGHSTVPQMMRAGFLLNLASIALLTAFARLLLALAGLDAY